MNRAQTRSASMRSRQSIFSVTHRRIPCSEVFHDDHRRTTAGCMKTAATDYYFPQWRGRRLIYKVHDALSRFAIVLAFVHPPLGGRGRGLKELFNSEVRHGGQGYECIVWRKKGQPTGVCAGVQLCSSRPLRAEWPRCRGRDARKPPRGRFIANG